MSACTPARLHFPMDRAYCCLTCDEVFEVAPTCPACASVEVEPIGKWLSSVGTRTRLGKRTIACPYRLASGVTCDRALTIVLAPDPARGVRVEDKYGCPLHAEEYDHGPIWAALAA